MYKLSSSGLILCLCLSGCSTKPPALATKAVPKVNSVSVATPPPPAAPAPMRRSSAQLGPQTLYVGPPPKPKVRPQPAPSSPSNQALSAAPAPRRKATTIIRPAQPQATYPVRTSTQRSTGQPAVIDLLPPPPLPPGYTSSPMANDPAGAGWGQRQDTRPRATTADTILRSHMEQRQERIRRTNEAIIRASQPQFRGPQMPNPFDYAQRGPLPPQPGYPPRGYNPPPPGYPPGGYNPAGW